MYASRREVVHLTHSSGPGTDQVPRLDIALALDGHRAARLELELVAQQLVGRA